MLLKHAQLQAAYEQVYQDAAGASGACSVLILVAPTADAMCACRILCSMLQSDVISYQVQPVSGYADVAAANAALVRGSGELRSVFLLGCGARRNVEKLLPDLPDSAHAYVADAHRPVHLANIYSDRKVVVLDDGYLGADEEGQLSDGDDLSGAEDTDSEPDSDDSDETSEESDGEAELDGGDPVGGDNDDDGNDDGDDDGAKRRHAGDGDADPPEGGAQRRRRKRGRNTLTPAELHAIEEARRVPAERRRRLREYYASDSYGLGASLVLYNLAERRAKDTNDLLWMAIVGLTDQFVHARIQKDMYLTHMWELHGNVVMKNADEDSAMQLDADTRVPVGERGRIAFEMELRFMLHRHWSLYEAMYYSNYVASKLRVWTTPGRQRMEELLAKMGFSLEQCRQKFRFTSANLRNKLTDQIDKYGEEYGLTDIKYGSFHRYLGFKTPFSAADIVYCATTLIEHRPDDPPGETAADVSEEVLDARERDAFQRSFNDAYDALGGHNPKSLQRGLDLSMSLQRAVVQQAVSMLEKNTLLRTTHFRYAYIRATEAHCNVIAQPCALARLALLLMDVHRESKHWTGANRRPLILLAERRTAYLVVGVGCPTSVDDALGCRFGAAFELAAARMAARVRLDGFDRNVVEVPRAHAGRFVEVVYETMDA
eukprot:TRINITY_DN1964_c2_g1_i2.p1 TRINITY_DN1964_c2_g1~~TRINITY_DN1964_c2_g1_i2.p1  ORF type:complete len:658 (-),score=278.74 TRINITY_DN1964_c2_g1_i2:501-2474(-)